MLQACRGEGQSRQQQPVYTVRKPGRSTQSQSELRSPGLWLAIGDGLHALCAGAWGRSFSLLRQHQLAPGIVLAREQDDRETTPPSLVTNRNSSSCAIGNASPSSATRCGRLQRARFHALPAIHENPSHWLRVLSSTETPPHARLAGRIQLEEEQYILDSNNRSTTDRHLRETLITMQRARVGASAALPK